MVRKDYTIREDQVEALKDLPGNASEHIRAALDEYLAKRRPLRVSTSLSKKGEYGTNFIESSAAPSK